MTEPNFFVVWCPTGGNPRVRHLHFEDAKREAERLARCNPGQEFIVLQTLGRAVKDDVRWSEFDCIPF